MDSVPSPGPGAYYLDQDTIARRVELEIGAGARLLGKLREIYENGIPGPGTYANLNLNNIKKFDKGYRMAKGDRETSLVDREQKKVPGPGQYDLTYFPKRKGKSLELNFKRRKRHLNSSGVTSMDKQILRYGVASGKKVQSYRDKVEEDDDKNDKKGLEWELEFRSQKLKNSLRARLRKKEIKKTGNN